MLLVDDDPGVLRVVGQLFERNRWSATGVTTGRAALAAYDRDRPDLVMLDLDLPDINGLDVLAALRSTDPDAMVVMLSGQGDVASAVQAMHLGAETFLAKPLEPRHFTATVERAYEKVVLRRRYQLLASRQVRDGDLATLGDSPAMRNVAQLVERYAAGAAPVLLTGETGSGKGWVAKLLHAASPRRGAPFVSVNCAGLSATFLDSELFGHERGAFTDARAQKAGLFEVADGGTLMLDEIADLAPELQPKLLTAIESQRFRRLGGTREIAVDVRLVAATHADLPAAVREGRFRADLFYRLAALPIRVPSLRERGRDDIVDLAFTILASLRQQLGRGPAQIAPDAIELLATYPWPGNVRELRNTLERAVLTAERDVELESVHFPAEMRERLDLDVAAGAGPGPGAEPENAADLSIATLERTHIQHVLELVDGNRTRAAKLLGLSRQGLYNRLALYGLLTT
ncbi:MAG: sigma-54 dependent transcriptional regulator [Gemmatimonadota bacterium]|nr:sigma-54 dependent transcriptional regulator [Gemmatimonadota bacterium]